MVLRLDGRASALTRLFDRDRVDAWQPWILLITVEAQLYNSSARATLRNYLKETGEDASSDTCQALEFLVSDAPTTVEETTRLIHGATAILVADSAKPKGCRGQAKGYCAIHGSKWTAHGSYGVRVSPQPKEY